MFIQNEQNAITFKDYILSKMSHKKEDMPHMNHQPFITKTYVGVYSNIQFADIDSSSELIKQSNSLMFLFKGH